MSTDLDRELAELAPAPARPVDVHRAWQRARRPRVPPAAPLVVVAMLVVVAAIAAVPTLIGDDRQDLAQEVDVLSGSAAADPDGPLFVLDRTRDGDDVTPPEIAADWAAALLPDDPDIRTAFTGEGLGFHVTRDVHGALCLLVTGVAEGLTGACATDAVFAHRGHLPLEVIDGDYDPTTDFWAVLVPNGIATVQLGPVVVAVQDNVAVGLDPPDGATEVVLDGPGGTMTAPIAVDLSPDTDDRAQPYPTASIPAVERPSTMVDENGCVDQAAGTAAVDEALRLTGNAVWWRWQGPADQAGNGISTGYGYERSAAPFGAVTDLLSIEPVESPEIEETQLVPFAERTTRETVDPTCALAAASVAGLDTPGGVAAAWVRAYDDGAVDRLLELTAGGVRPGETLEDFIDHFGLDRQPGSPTDVESVGDPEPGNTETTVPVRIVTGDRSLIVTLVGQPGGGNWTVIDVEPAGS